MKQKTKFIIVLAIIGILIIGISLYSLNQINLLEKLPQANENIKKHNEPLKIDQCQVNNGVWLENYRECELHNLSEKEGREKCKEMNGVYNFCASECRHNLKSEICVANCVPVCKF